MFRNVLSLPSFTHVLLPRKRQQATGPSETSMSICQYETRVLWQLRISRFHERGRNSRPSDILRVTLRAVVGSAYHEGRLLFWFFIVLLSHRQVSVRSTSTGHSRQTTCRHTPSCCFQDRYDRRLMKCDIVHSGRNLSTFHRKILKL